MKSPRKENIKLISHSFSSLLDKLASLTDDTGVHAHTVEKLLQLPIVSPNTINIMKHIVS